MILRPGEVAKAATDAFRVYTDEPPDLVRTGIPPLDKAIGGLFPGSGGILAIAQGVGKSSTVLTSAVSSPDPVGVVSVEDTEDVIGARLLALKTGLDSRLLRLKQLSSGQLEALQHAELDLREEQYPLYACIPGGSLTAVEEAVGELSEAGCRLIWLDYVQKVRGVSDARNVEVATTYTRFQKACRDGGSAFMVTSQFSRQADPTQRPRVWWLKETGDLENEARVIIMGWRNDQDRNLIHFSLDKCTFGGEGLTWSYRRDESGTLRYVEDTW